MNSLCQSYAAQYRDGEHRWDPVEFRTYETEYRCLDCGETSIHYTSGQGG